MQKPTKAAQKVPHNAEELIMDSFLREALMHQDSSICHACFKVNVDQTYIALLMAVGLTFDTVGAKQVSGVGLDDK